MGPDGQREVAGHAAYGIFYEPYYTGQGGPLQSPISAPPYLQTAQVSFPQFDNPLWRAASSGRDLREPAYQSDAGTRICRCPTRRTGT